MVRLNGGLSVISAFYNGIGSAVALDLPMTVEVTGSSSPHDEKKHDAAYGILRFYRKSLGIDRSFGIRVESEIPQGYGLKSSSALAFGILEALSHEAGVEMDPYEKCALAARASIDAGISRTGSYDDILASCFGGVSLADNARFTEIFHSDVRTVGIVLAYRDGKARYSSRVDIEPGSIEDEIVERMMKIVKEGDFISAAAMNGRIMERFYPADRDICDAFAASGSYAWGQSGKGPAVFGAFSDGSSMESCIEALSLIRGVNVIKTVTSNVGSKVIS